MAVRLPKKEKEDLMNFIEEKTRNTFCGLDNFEEHVNQMAGSVQFEVKMERGELHCPQGYTWVRCDWGHREFEIYRCEGGAHFAFFIKEDLGHGMVKKPDGTVGYSVGGVMSDEPDDTPVD